jgi:hypothetical protein
MAHVNYSWLSVYVCVLCCIVLLMITPHTATVTPCSQTYMHITQVKLCCVALH